MPRDPENGDLALVGGRYLVEHDPVFEGDAAAESSRLVPGVGWVPTSAPMRGAGNDANRVHIVFVGDGYTQGQLGLYAQQVDSFAVQMFRDEPLTTYQPLFEVYRVDVVSNESGVSNDPSPGINRDTAMDMQYWCGGTERLLCVNTGAARAFADSAPLPDGQGADQIVAVANSSKYGGAGYSSLDIGTAAAGNGSAVEIVVHELGHSMGNLADEYTYGGPTTFTGSEPGTANVSIYPFAEMQTRQTKWHRWLGDNTPAFDGATGTFEGGQYSVFGIYRPTSNSKMRALGRPFNLVSAEALIKEIYRLVEPIDSVSPDPELFHTGRPVLSVDPVDPDGNPLDVEWFINSAPYAGPLQDGGLTLDTADIPFSGITAIKARVRDNTPWVRDEAFRDASMTQEALWTVSLSTPCLADVNQNGQLEPTDFGAWLSAFNQGDPAADQNQNGAVEPTDFGAWLANYNAGCD